MKNKVIMHVNYCEQGQTIPELCRKAADWGFDGIEFRGRRAGVQETPEEYLDLIARSVADAGLSDVLFGYPTPDMMLPDAGERAREIEAGLAFYERAKARLGDRFTLSNAFTGTLTNPDKSVPYSQYERNGSGCATEAHWTWAAEGYRLIGDAVARLGIRLAFETHMGYLHDTPQAAMKLVDRIGRPCIGINLDYGNAVYFPANPSLAETIPALGRRIFYTHLKNSLALPGGGRIQTALGDGDINHREYLRLLREVLAELPAKYANGREKESLSRFFACLAGSLPTSARGSRDIGFTGPIGIEAPRPGDRESFAKPDLTYIRSVVRDLG
jgi:sugar phosphate isomerase/epimerase